ncbi:TetR/AcrR family transcriptional regulator [Marinomonas ostreistagni]|uniref:TetR/AcrR family transcriptional regulator n=1 Tax=Marinomonas ostreistagni TaxID=359209 RepID=A0ABS0Z8V3_9GAMM|nr:TetR/AcrR family transcriptional regulator [Marinomonas ostreistagni]MBJ7550090.1 TetR/AcrR family transcriptional regulator [Marinomonas ostreistagni]
MARGRPSKKGVIAEAALRLFEVAGYQGTSIDQVVLEAGVSKPTVYSNYPSKLLLWQEVLKRIITRSQLELDQLCNKLEQDEVLFSEGWVRLWLEWSSAKDRIAAYRVHWGEQHKLSADEKQLFDEFENALTSALKRWMRYHSIHERHLFILFASAREAFLLPKISQCASSVKQPFESYQGLIDAVLKDTQID